MEFEDFEENNDNLFEENEILGTAWDKTEQKIEPKSGKPRTMRKPLPKLTEMELIQPNGLPALKSLFDNFHSSEKHYENLGQVLQKMEYWAHNLHPQLNFENFIEKINTINKKRLFREALNKIRMGFPLEYDFNRDIEAEDVDDDKEKDDNISKSSSNKLLNDEHFDKKKETKYVDDKRKDDTDYDEDDIVLNTHSALLSDDNLSDNDSILGDK